MNKLLQHKEIKFNSSQIYEHYVYSIHTYGIVNFYEGMYIGNSECYFVPYTGYNILHMVKFFS